jgi:hypothetical protein
MSITEVKMIHAGPWGQTGTLIPIAVSADDTASSIKRKLERPTGLAAKDIKLMLGAFSQLVAGDKRLQKFGSCGRTEGLGLTVEVSSPLLVNDV